MNNLSPTAARPVIAVIGGGVSGTLFALHLLRDAPMLVADIRIIELRPVLGAGLAYSTPGTQHRINVAAARMAVFAEDPTDFDRWFRASGELIADPAALAANGGAYPTRAAFGRYLRDRLADSVAQHRAAPCTHVRDRALAVVPDADGYVVTLAQGGTLHADLVVLATGHPAAELPAALRSLADTASLVADPWASGGLAGIAPDARVAIIGTGLTMTDVLATLRAAGHRGKVTAMSRRGLLPRPRTPLPVQARGDFASQPATAALDLLRRVRAEITRGAKRGLPWEDVIDALRVQARTVWAALPSAERKRLLRHVQPYWDVHRYQSAPQINDILQHELASGGLRVLAASLIGAEQQGGGAVALHLHPRGRPAAERVSVTADAVVACTGPAHRLGIARNPVLQALSEAGLIRPDAYGLGIDTDSQGCAIGTDGQAHPDLLVAGPPARAAWGELMGLPQVSSQPRELAAYTAARLSHEPFLSAQEAHA